MVINRKLQIDENVRLISSKAENECNELREQLEAMEKEVKERKATIQAKAGTLLNTSASSSTPAPVVGAVSLEVASGYLLHSSQVDRTYVQTMLANSGINPTDTETVAQILMNILNTVATKIEAPEPSAAAPSTQPLNQGPVLIADDKKTDAEIKQQTVEGDMDFTEGSTDTEAEAKAATANEPPSKTRKKISKKDRDAKLGKGPGKGSAKDIIKPADKDKGKKKGQNED